MNRQKIMTRGCRIKLIKQEIKIKDIFAAKILEMKKTIKQELSSSSQKVFENGLLNPRKSKILENKLLGSRGLNLRVADLFDYEP